MHIRLLEWGKRLRDMLLLGDVYPPIESPELDLVRWNARQIHLPQANCGSRQIFRRKQSTSATQKLQLSGISPDLLYRLEYFTGETVLMPGSRFAELVVQLDKPRSFQLIRYQPAV